MSETEIFRFLFVSPPKLQEGKSLKKKTIKFEENPSNLLEQLIKFKEKDKYPEILKEAQETFDNGKVFNSIEAFQEEFIEEEDFLKWIMNLIEEEEEIKVNEIEDELKDRDINFEKVNDLWDALSVHSLLDNPIGIVDLIVGLIRLAKLVDLLTEGKIDDSEEIIQIMESQVVLPKELFPIIFEAEETEEEGSEEEEESEEEKQKQIIEQLEALEKAKEELNRVFKGKIDQLKNTPATFDEFVQQQSTPIATQAQDIDIVQPEGEESGEININIGEAEPISNEELENRYSNYVQQRNTTRLVEADIQGLEETTQSTLNELKLGELEATELSELINQIDSQKKELASQLNAGQGYTLAHFDGLLAVNFPQVTEASCLKRDTGESYCQLLKRLKREDPNQPIANILGKGDYKVVRQKLLGYKPGEIAHIKNVFAHETFERQHRDLKRTEEYVETETERETEQQNEISTSDRFEMSKEISEQVNKDSQKSQGVSVSGGYGPVRVGANANYSSSSSSSKNSKSASKYARETTEKASNKLREKVREKRTVTSINEVEIINSYKIENTDPTPKVGIYRWVDKYYENQIYNLGKRLMLEFYIPSPMQFYLYSKQGKQAKGVTVLNPIHPSENKGVFQNKPLRSHKDITRDNAHIWQSAYNVSDVKPAPKEYDRLSLSFKIDGEKSAVKSWEREFDIPEKYEAYKGRYAADGHKTYQIMPFFKVFAEGWVKTRLNGWWTEDSQTHDFWVESNAAREKFRLSGLSSGPGMVFLALDTRLTEEGFEEWQISVYNSIMESYENMKAEYENQLAAAQIQAGIQIDGNNPETNRQIEKVELQKWCTEALLLDRFENWNAMKRARTGQPEIDFNQLKKEMPVVSFMNTAFEWDNMTYMPYPYFYGNKADHPSIRELADTDHKFTAMLQAGYCRVIVPVSYGFEAAVLHLISTGQMWNGGALPVLGDPLFQSIVDAIKGKEYDSIGTPEGTPWKTKIPTNLVWLNNSDPDGQL